MKRRHISIIRDARLHTDKLGDALVDIHSLDGLITHVLRHVVRPDGSTERPADPYSSRWWESRPTERRAEGRVVLPAFVDCHTHACWVDPGIPARFSLGSHRLDEWEMKRNGTPYLDILRAGGGIMATVRAVRAATQSELAGLLHRHLNLLMDSGTRTVEVKSGYGLTTADELKMLRAIRDYPDWAEPTVVPTALLGHAIDPDVPRDVFVKRTIGETLDAVHSEFPGITIDAYCEEGAWSPDECEALFRRADELGHPFRVHVDQFNSLGFTQRAIGLGALSVDHLEASTPADVEAIIHGPAAGSSDLHQRHGPFAVALPACGFHLDGRYANLAPIAAAAPHRVCIATNLNPGSAPCWSMPFVIGLAVQHCGLSLGQAIAAATINPARMLGFQDRGEIAIGKRADLIVLNTVDVRSLAFTSGLQLIYPH
ncbi:MAG: amidohydrolase family protein [Phycisphaerales bacterium]